MEVNTMFFKYILNGTEVWITNPYEEYLNELVLTFFGGVKRVVFLGFPIDSSLVSEVVNIAKYTKVMIYSNLSSQDGDQDIDGSAYQVLMDMYDLDNVTVSHHDRRDTPSLIKVIEPLSLKGDDTLIIVNDGYICVEGDDGMYDYEVAISALYACLWGVGITYDGMMYDAEFLSYKSYAEERDMSFDSISRFGYLIEVAMFEAYFTQMEMNFLHLVRSVHEDMFNLLCGDKGSEACILIFAQFSSISNDKLDEFYDFFVE